jgi:hypothetical protein
VSLAFTLPGAITVLERTPGVLLGLLGSQPDGWTRQDEGPGTWSPYDVVGHLIHGERTDWIPRLRVVLQHGTARAFEPFDREAQFRESRDRSLSALLVEFASLRAASLRELRAAGLGEAHWDLRGMHPELGAVTLRNLLATWVVHDLGHVAQVARVMARQYRDEVGPWRAYLPILDRG